MPGPEDADAFFVARPGSPDAVVAHLAREGLRIEGALRLLALTGQGDVSRAPTFLRTEDSDTEQFERLDERILSLYRRLGQAKYLLDQVRDLYLKEYNVAPVPPRNVVEAKQLMTKLFRASADDSIAAEALHGAFIVTLTSALDSLAGIATLLLDLDFGIWSATFPKLVTALKHAKADSDYEARQRMVLRVADAVLPTVDVDGRLADWVGQLYQYRHAFAHRPLTQQLGFSRRGPSGYRRAVYLLLDPYARSRETLPDASRVAGVDQEDARRLLGAFTDQTVEGYCDWVFKHVVALTRKAMDSFVGIYEERSANPGLFNNNSLRILHRDERQKGTRFRGLPG